jgi:prophage maintenance system killer protein
MHAATLARMNTRSHWLAQSHLTAATQIQQALNGDESKAAHVHALAQRLPEYRGHELLLARLLATHERASALGPQVGAAQLRAVLDELRSLAREHAALRNSDGTLIKRQPDAAKPVSAAVTPALVQQAEDSGLRPSDPKRTPPWDGSLRINTDPPDDLGATSTNDPYAKMQAAFDVPLPADLQSRLTQRWARIDQRAQRIAGQVDLNANTPLTRQIDEALEWPRMRLSLSHYPQRVGERSAVQSIMNWRSAEATMSNALRAGTPITAANIKLLNSVFGIDQPRPVVRGVTQRFGEYRTTPMAPQSYPSRTYLPPESIERAMNDFEHWYERAENSGMPPVQIAAQAYARLSSIHPFPDANGRTARLVMNWILRSHGLPTAGLAPEHINRMVEDLDGSNVVPVPGVLEQELTSAIESSLDTVEGMLRPPSRGQGFGR